MLDESPIPRYIGKIFNSFELSDVMKYENKNWLVEVLIDIDKCKVALINSCEMPEWDRNIIIGMDSFIEYIDKPIKRFDIINKGFIKYNFIEKIIDEKNNFIVLAETDGFEITEEYEDDDRLE